MTPFEKTNLIVEIHLDDLLDLINMSDLKFDAKRERDGDKIFIEVFGFQNAGDVCTIDGVITGKVAMAP